MNERLQEVRGRIPAGLDPGLGPNATPFGEVYQFTIEGDKVPLDEKKAFLDWVIRPLLRTVPGIVEVETWGGRTRQYEIEVRPESLERYSLSLSDVEKAVSSSNENFGGGFFEFAGEQYTVVGKGRATRPAELENIVIASRSGTPVLVRDVADVKIGAVQRQGATLRDGHGESVSAILANRADIYLVDLGLPDVDGIDLIKLISEKCPDAHSIVISTFGDAKHVMRSLRSGASGYLLKEEIQPSLIDKIIATHNGHRKGSV